jgi:glutathione S-transferase
MALAISGVRCQIREVKLRAKPSEMLAASSKGTVPIVVAPDGAVIDESLDIMRWALTKSDPEGWLSREDAALIATNDDAFKQALDGYKYPERHACGASAPREQGLVFLRELEARLSVRGQLCGTARGFTDAAIMPFVRQFAAVDKQWFDAQALQHVQNWLNGHLESDLFEATMVRLTPWSAGDHPIFFPSYESSSTVG